MRYLYRYCYSCDTYRRIEVDNKLYKDLKRMGLIYGEKVYLVAREKAKGDGIYNYLLHKFEKFELTDEKFEKGDFNLQKYSNRSFGVYQGEQLNVKLLFSKSSVAATTNMLLTSIATTANW